MTAMIEEIENDHDLDNDYDDESSISEIFRSSSGFLDSLDKLTNEIKEDLMSAEDTASVTCSNQSSSNDDAYDDDFYSDDDDENEYSDDDEDPDSGENKLFSMMDELVMELKMELKDDEDNNTPVVYKENDESIVQNGEHTAAMVDNNDNNGVETTRVLSSSAKDRGQNTKETDDSVSLSLGSIPSEEWSSTNSNSSQPIDDRAEKHIKLRHHVKTLLRQVTEIANSGDANKMITTNNNNHHDTSILSSQRREQGDNDTDRLEHLMGAIATYGKFTDTNTFSSSSPSKSHISVKIKKKERKQRTNKHKKRHSKSSVSYAHTQQSLQILFDSLLSLDGKLSREHLPRH